MRDVARIPRILDLIGDTWRKYPDLRLGQLLVYLGVTQESADDFFYREDYEWERVLLKKIAEER